MSQYRVECNHCRLDFYCSLATPLFVVYRLPYGGSVSRSAVFLCRPIASKGRLIDRRVGLKLSSLNEGHTSTSLMSSKERFLDSQVSLRSTRVIPLIWCLSLHYLVQFPLRSQSMFARRSRPVYFIICFSTTSISASLFARRVHSFLRVEFLCSCFSTKSSSAFLIGSDIRLSSSGCCL